MSLKNQASKSVHGFSQKNMNNKLRSRIINSVIKTGKRIETNVTPDGDVTFYGCEVCWTCEYFKIEGNECILSYKDAKERKESLSIDASHYFTPVFIREPAWLRCSWWKEKDE